MYSLLYRSSSWPVLGRAAVALLAGMLTYALAPLPAAWPLGALAFIVYWKMPSLAFAKVQPKSRAELERVYPWCGLLSLVGVFSVEIYHLVDTDWPSFAVFVCQVYSPILWLLLILLGLEKIQRRPVLLCLSLPLAIPLLFLCLRALGHAPAPLLLFTGNAIASCIWAAPYWAPFVFRSIHPKSRWAWIAISPLLVATWTVGWGFATAQ